MKLKLYSDGTNNGTRVIDEDTGEMVHGILKLNWEANAEELITKVGVEFFSIPVEITTKADVDLYEWDKTTGDITHTKSFEKTVRIVSEKLQENLLAVPTINTFVYDVETNEKVGAIQKITWEATPSGSKAKIKKIKFDNKDW
jgi:hypothetical protein